MHGMTNTRPPAIISGGERHNPAGDETPGMSKKQLSSTNVRKCLILFTFVYFDLCTSGKIATDNEGNGQDLTWHHHSLVGTTGVKHVCRVFLSLETFQKISHTINRDKSIMDKQWQTSLCNPVTNKSKRRGSWRTATDVNSNFLGAAQRGAITAIDDDPKPAENTSAALRNYTSLIAACVYVLDTYKTYKRTRTIAPFSVHGLTEWRICSCKPGAHLPVKRVGLKLNLLKRMNFLHQVLS